MWHHVGNPLRCVLFGVYIEILRLFFWLGFFFCGTGGATKNAFLGFFAGAVQECSMTSPVTKGASVKMMRRPKKWREQVGGVKQACWCGHEWHDGHEDGNHGPRNMF
jgi:hypothetical protein